MRANQRHGAARRPSVGRPRCGAPGKRAATLVVAGLLGALAGCRSYPARTQAAFSAFQRGQFDAAMVAYGDSDTTGSAFLSGAEAGQVALTAGDWEGALAYLQRAADEVREFESRALVSSEDFGEELFSWVWNDSAKSYKGEGFERVYVHCDMAQAYLALGRLEDVRVETRLANRLLENEEELYETEYGAGGLGHFLSAVSYELEGDMDDAYIDYKRMEAKGVGLEVAGPALVRHARELGFDDDARRWEERFGADYPRPPDAASVVVIAGVGTGPYKVESSLAIPTGDGVFTWAVPRYEDRPQEVGALRLVVGSTSIRTVVIEDVSAVARENLDDRIAWLAAKSAARGMLKREMAYQGGKEFGDWAFLVGNLYALVSERADLRCWHSLPNSWQALRLFLPAGTHTLDLEAAGGERVGLGTFELVPGETMIVLARTIGRRLYAHPIGGRLVDPRLDPSIRADETLAPTTLTDNGAQP